MIKINARDITSWGTEIGLVVIGLLHPVYLPEVVPLLVATFLGHAAITNSSSTTEKVN